MLEHLGGGRLPLQTTPGRRYAAAAGKQPRGFQLDPVMPRFREILTLPAAAIPSTALTSGCLGREVSHEGR
eukprot:6208824-Amphidinium_carterae.1